MAFFPAGGGGSSVVAVLEDLSEAVAKPFAFSFFFLFVEDLLDFK